MEDRILIEVCCGSPEDAMTAYRAGADRVELNRALELGGLSPTPAEVSFVKKEVPGLIVIAMVRPRGGGFTYSGEEYMRMLSECENLLKAGADGIAFGFLHEDGSVDEMHAAAFVELIHRYGKQAVFHRAVDITPDRDAAFEVLIGLGIDRVLTSGGEETAMAGAEEIAWLQKTYGSRISILPGSGINAGNAASLIKMTGVHEIHSSCKSPAKDPTARRETVDFGGHNKVSADKVRNLRKAVDNV